MSKSDPAAVMGKLLDSYWMKQAGALSVAFPAKVITFDTGACTATVEPLIQTGDQAPSVIQNVSTIGQRVTIDGIEKVLKPALNSNDIVLVVCADRELGGSINGQTYKPSSQRMHSANDALIVGVLPCSL